MKTKTKIKRKTKTAVGPSLKTLKSRLWKIVSAIVRLTGADWKGINKCYTCPARVHYKQMNAGHFKHGKLDFDLRNLKPQCVSCNLWGHGKLDVYATRLVRDHGIDWVEQLERDAAQKGNNYSREELLELMITFKQKLNDLMRYM